MKRIYLFLLLLTFSACEIDSGTYTNESGETFYKISKIVDGDTIHLIDENGETLKVRLIGIDAPESRDSQYKKKEPFGEEATLFLTKLIGNSKIRLEYDINPVDKFGRTLAYTYTEDGTFLNAEMVKQGYARTMTIQPNSKYADYFFELLQEAKKNKRGMWK